jgi:hypothetical protein
MQSEPGPVGGESWLGCELIREGSPGSLPMWGRPRHVAALGHHWSPGPRGLTVEALVCSHLASLPPETGT